MRYEIATRGGVTEVGQDPGTVVVQREEGSTMVDLTVADDAGAVVVYLTRELVSELMLALGAAAVDL